MKKIIVTSGQPFTDIDALACAIAYTELLQKEGKNAETILPGPLNKSITRTIKKWNLKYSEKSNSKNANFVLVDISEPDFFASFVVENNVVEIFDHRYGFEEYWKEELGDDSHIEMVGACATLIWEEYGKRLNPVKISKVTANLLLTAIASNTLNFKASVTTTRDLQAFHQVKNHIKLPNNWIEKYFKDQDREKLGNIKETILNDTKNISGPIIGQIEMWDSQTLFDKHLDEIEETMKSFGKDEWYLTSPSISEGKNYIFTKNKETKKLLENIIDARFDGDVGTTQKLWLRKEIVKQFKVNT